MEAKKEMLDKIFERGTIVEAYPNIEKLKSRLLSEKLRIYIGFDATSKSLHLGHASNIMLLEDLRKMGHEVILLFGDFTGMVGDPSDKADARTVLTEKIVNENISFWKEQVKNIIKIGYFGNGAKIKRNSTWLSKINLAKFLEVAQHLTVSQLLERDMFEKRMNSGKAIYLNEFLYPLLQGWDSVAMNVDAELCGTDQTFNALVGRDLQKTYNKKDKMVIASILIQDEKTGDKMSKSLGNGVSLDTDHNDMFGRIMALTDGLIIPLFRHCTRVKMEKVLEIQKSIESRTMNPKDAKLELAYEITKIFYGENNSEKARNNWKSNFENNELTEENKVIKVSNGDSLLDVLVENIETVTSIGGAKRMIKSGAVYVNDKKIEDVGETLELNNGSNKLKCGRVLITLEKK